MTMTPLQFLYHGSSTPNIKEFEPRKRYTPGALGKDVPPAIYATDDAAYASGHAFPWSSKEGFDLRYENGKLVLIVPEKEQDRLNQKIYIYKLKADNFELLPDVSPKGRTFWSLKPATPIEVKEFQTVKEAVEFYGGNIRLV